MIPSQPYTHTRSNTTTEWAKRVYIACERTDYIEGGGSLFIQEWVVSRPWIVPPIQRFILNPYHHYIYTIDYSKATRWSAPGRPLGSPWVVRVRPWADHGRASEARSGLQVGLTRDQLNRHGLLEHRSRVVHGLRMGLPLVLLMGRSWAASGQPFVRDTAPHGRSWIMLVRGPCHSPPPNLATPSSRPWHGRLRCAP